MRTYPTSLLDNAFATLLANLVKRTLPYFPLGNAYAVHTLLPYLVMRTLPYFHLMQGCSANARVMRTLLPESISLCPVNLPVLPPQHVEWMQKTAASYSWTCVIQVAP